MTVTERITMTMRVIDRHKVIKDVADGLLKPWRQPTKMYKNTWHPHRKTKSRGKRKGGLAHAHLLERANEVMLEK